ncbi:MAG: DNA cytosine methyltransferase, partial [Bacilli bacterium]|nr:DNA cytosine methyltransferase [Bacilli bacterium]
MSDTSTRSGMLWEVERRLSDLDEKPQILLMENVPMIHSQDNMDDFNKWQLRLEELGYKNYWQDLIATDYGVPQTRNRTFMVSILGDYNYTFPKPIPLKLKLKDMLEDNVDEKYFLSDKQIKDIQNWNAYEKPLETVDKEISKTLTTRVGAYCAGMQLVKDTPNYIEWEDGKNIQMNCRAWKDDKIVATLNTGGETKILVKNNTKQGYLEATDGDGIDISSRMEYHRGTVQKGKTQTLTTMGGENNGVVVNMKTKLCNDLIQQG